MVMISFLMSTFFSSATARQCSQQCRLAQSNYLLNKREKEKCASQTDIYPPLRTKKKKEYKRGNCQDKQIS